MKKAPLSDAERAKRSRDRKRKQKAAAALAAQGTITVTGRTFWQREPSEEVQAIFDEFQSAVAHWARPIGRRGPPE